MPAMAAWVEMVELVQTLRVFHIEMVVPAALVAMLAQKAKAVAER